MRFSFGMKRIKDAVLSPSGWETAVYVQGFGLKAVVPFLL